MPRTSSPTWIACCRAFAMSEGVAPELLEVLEAFRSPGPRGGPPPPPEARFEGDFEELEREQLDAAPFEPAAASLRGEVDADQAQLFARRLASVDDALAELNDASARLLRVGLRVRLAGMILAPGPRALRMRALADFYYSQLGRHLHARTREHSPGLGPSLAARVEGLRWEALAPGLAHARISGPSAMGPVYINLLRADPRRVRIEAHDCREALRAGQDFVALAASLGAKAAVSGGFFLYSEPDIEAPSARFDPVGLLLSCGRLLSPPIFRRGSVLVDEEGGVQIARLGPDALQIELGAQRLSGAGARTRAQGTHGPDSASVAIVGREIVALGERLAVPLNGYVLPIDAALAAQLRVGDRVNYGPLRGPSGAPLRCAIAGGPILREAGRALLDMRAEDFWASAPPVTFSQDETGDRNLLPRLAAGLDADGQLVLAAIDGRHFERALGMTLGEVGELMGLLGCAAVTNLDGGSSKRMLVDGRIVDLASTEIRAVAGQGRARVRPVHTGLFLIPRA